jgi:hypothetical protein
VGARGRREERKKRRKPLPNNLRFSGTFCGSLVMAENDSDMEDLEMCAKFGVF